MNFWRWLASLFVKKKRKAKNIDVRKLIAAMKEVERVRHP